MQSLSNGTNESHFCHQTTTQKLLALFLKPICCEEIQSVHMSVTLSLCFRWSTSLYWTYIRICHADCNTILWILYGC